MHPPKKLALGHALCAGVLLLSIVLYFWQLGAKPFWDYDEAIYANVVHDTLESGDFLTLHLGDGPWFEKPPLSFWSAIGIDHIFNNPELSFRITAAIAGVISVVLVMLITFELSGNLITAALAGLILLTTGTFLEAVREFRLDVPAIAMILFSVYSFIRGTRSPIWFIGVGTGLALGFLFKSIIGLLSIPFILIWSAYAKDFSWIKNRFTWISIALFFVILAPWYLFENSLYGQTFWQASLGENFSHFGSNILTHSYSSQDYINFFLTFAAPWTTLFLVLLVWLGFNYKKYIADGLREVFVFATTVVFLFAIFLLASTKILDYLLPMYPFVAIAIALGAEYLVKSYRSKVILIRFGAAGLAGCIIFAFWVAINFGFHIFPYIAVNDTIVGEEHDVGKMIAQEPPTLKLYTYQYDYYDTIEYYSGRKSIVGMSDDQALGEPFLLVVSKPFMDSHAFPPELQAHLATLYKGQVIILYKFTP